MSCWGRQSRTRVLAACIAAFCFSADVWSGAALGQSAGKSEDVSIKLLETTVSKGTPVFVRVAGVRVIHGGPQPMLMISKRGKPGRVQAAYLHRLAPHAAPNRWYSFQDLDVGAYDMHLLRGHAPLVTRPFRVADEPIPKATIYSDTLIGYHAAGNSTRNEEPYGMLNGEPKAVPVEPAVVLGDPGPGPFQAGRNSDMSFLALPKGSHVTVGFSQHHIVDGPGPDIVIQTVSPSGSAGEMAAIHVRTDNGDFVPLGEIYEGGPQYIDLKGKSLNGPVTAVRVTGLDNGGRIQGFDIISVGAYSYEPRGSSFGGHATSQAGGEEEDAGMSGAARSGVDEESSGSHSEGDSDALPDFSSGTGPQSGSSSRHD